MKKIVTILIFLSVSLFSLAQNNLLDSLWQEYKTLEDAGKRREAVEVLRELVDQWIEVNPLTASQYAAMANQEAKELGDSTLLALTYNDIGQCYLAQKTYFMATESFFKAYDYFMKVNDQKNIAYTLLNIGQAYLMQGIEDIAESKFKESVKIFEKLNDTSGLAHAFQFLGMANLRADQEQSIKDFEKAIQLFESLGKETDVAKTRYFLAEAYYEFGDDSSAYLEINKALEAFTRLDNRIQTGKSYLLLSKILKEQGKYDASLEYAFKALDIFSDFQSNEKIAETYYVIADVYFEKDDIDKAILYANKTLKISEVFNFLELSSKAYNLLSSCYEEKGDYRNSFVYQKKYANSLEQLYEQNKQQHFSSFQMNLETQNKQKKIELIKIQAEKERLRLAKEQYRRNFIYILIIAFLTILFIVFLITRMREKVKITHLLESTNAQLTDEIEIRKKTELQLKNSEERYKLLFRKTPIGIMQYNEALIITDANDRFAEIFKVPRKQIVNATLDKIFDRNVILMLKHALEKNDEVYSEQVEILTKEGIVYVTMTIKPYVYNNGEEIVKSAIVIVQDITKHKKTEELYKRNIVRKQKLLELLPDSLILVDGNGDILEAHLPHSPDKEVGVRNIEELLPQKAIKLFKSEIELSIERNHVRRFFFTTSKGRKLLARIIPDSEGNALIVISQLPESESDFRDSKLAVLDKGKVNAKQKLLRDLEHEIENDLIPIYQNLQRALSFIILKTFIERIDNISQKYSLQELSQYKEKLNEALTEFDVARVNEILSEFPSVISKYIGYESITL